MTERQHSQDFFQQYTYNLSSICHEFFNIDETGSLLMILDPSDATNPDQVNAFDATNPDQVNWLKKVNPKVCKEFKMLQKMKPPGNFRDKFCLKLKKKLKMTVNCSKSALNIKKKDFYWFLQTENCNSAASFMGKTATLVIFNGNLGTNWRKRENLLRSFAYRAGGTV